MPTMQAFAKDHPIMKAWDEYKVSEEFRNSFKHAANLEYRTGSMWAAFLQGYIAAGGLNA